MAVLGAFFLFLVMSISAETIALVALPVIILGIIIYCLSLIWDFIITYPILISFVAVLTLPVLYFISEKYNNNSNYCHIKNDNKNVLFDEKKALENKFDEIFKYHILLQIVSDFNDSGYLKHNSPTYKFFFDSDILSHYPEFEKNLIKTQWYDVCFYLVNKNHMIEFLNICFSSNEYIFFKYNTNWEKMSSTIWIWYQKNFKITVPVSNSNLDKYLKNNEDFLKINFPYFDIKLKIDKAPLDLFDVIQNWKKNNQVL